MSTSPMLPSGSSIKSFWQRPEGKTGMVFAAFAAAGAIYGLGLVLPFLIALTENLLYLGMLGVAAVIFFMVVTNKRVWSLGSYLFKMVMRFLTGMVIELDPIAIIRERLAKMKRKLQDFTSQKATVRGQLRILDEKIAANEKATDDKLGAASSAKQMAEKDKDEDHKRRMLLQAKKNANAAQRATRANLSYKQLREKLGALYSMFNRYTDHLEFFIEDQEDEVNQLEVQYKTINAAHKAYLAAASILKGDADDNEIYDMTLEHLAENFGTKLGEIEDFGDFATNFMDGVDIQNAAVDSKGLVQLEAYEKKLLNGSPSEPEYLPMTKTDMRQPIPVTGKAASSGYDDLIK